MGRTRERSGSKAVSMSLFAIVVSSVSSNEGIFSTSGSMLSFAAPTPKACGKQKSPPLNSKPDVAKAPQQEAHSHCPNAHALFWTPFGPRPHEPPFSVPQPDSTLTASRILSEERVGC